MTVRQHRDGPVLHLTLDRPDKYNAFDEQVIALLTEALEQAGRSDARVILLGGSGRHFCAGGDLAWMRRSADFSHAENLADAERLATLLHTLYRCPVPVITRVQGVAYGGATGLIAASTISLCADDARFCFSEARIGLLPATIGPYVVQAIGARQARRYFTTAEEFDAATALRLGLVHEVVPMERLDQRVDEVIGALLQCAPGAQAQVPALLERLSAPLDETLRRDTARLIATLRASDEGREGLEAFLGKRAPRWRQEWSR